MSDDPIEIIAKLVADGRGADMAGNIRVGRATLRKARAIFDALKAAGYIKDQR